MLRGHGQTWLRVGSHCRERHINSFKNERRVELLNKLKRGHICCMERYELQLFPILCPLTASAQTLSHTRALTQKHTQHRLEAVRFNTAVWIPAVIAFLVSLSQSLLLCPPTPCHSLYSFHTHPPVFLASAAFSHLWECEAGSDILLVRCLLTSPSSLLCKCHTHAAPSTGSAPSSAKKS